MQVLILGEKDWYKKNPSVKNLTEGFFDYSTVSKGGTLFSAPT